MPFEAPTNDQLKNRYMHHAPLGTQAGRYQEIRDECFCLAKTIADLTPVSPEQTRALNALDEVMFLANAAIARNDPIGGQAPPPRKL